MNGQVLASDVYKESIDLQRRIDEMFATAARNPYVCGTAPLRDGSIITGTGILNRLQPSIGDVMEQEREAATAAERARVLAVLEKFKPMEQPYTRRDWALEQKGEKAMWERLMKAISEPKAPTTESGQ